VDVTYYNYDHLGNVRLTYRMNSGPNGTSEPPVVLNGMFDYFPFGKELKSWELGQERFRFTGKERDAETGIDYFQARNYDSHIGRFLGVDPLMEKYLDLSSFSYTGGNPILFFDPNGQELIEIKIKTNSEAIKGNSNLIVDKKISQMVKNLVGFAIENDISVQFNSSFRSSKSQEDVQKNGTTPARVGTSRHEGGFALNFNLFDSKGNLIKGNKSVTKENDFIKKEIDLGFRWGGEFSDPDKIHIDAWPAEDFKNFDYESWEAAYKENQKEKKDNTYDSEEYEKNKKTVEEK
jgi:RHS repeat-associated protein